MLANKQLTHATFEMKQAWVSLNSARCRQTRAFIVHTRDVLLVSGWLDISTYFYSLVLRADLFYAEHSSPTTNAYHA